MADVVNNEKLRRFEVDVEGEPAVLEYRIRDGALWLLHTGVPDKGQGKGVAAALARAAFDHARQEGQMVVPMCAFVVSYLRRHPELMEQVQPEYRSRVAGDS
jgi:predicted GNAT family acetyltransferase